MWQLQAAERMTSQIWTSLEQSGVSGTPRLAASSRRMRRVLSISEVVETLATPSGLVEVLATGDAEYDEDKTQMEMRLDSQFRPVEVKSDSRRPLPAGLPRRDVVKVSLDWMEALPAARDIFRDWAKRVHQSITNTKNLN